MMTKSTLPAWKLLVLFAAAQFFASAALATETRHCNAEVRFLPQNASQTWITRDFSVHRTVNSITQVNRARREARAQAVRCLRDHWAERSVEGRPRACRDAHRMEFHGYPFTNLEDEMTRALCNANLGEPNLTISVELHMSGNVGCHFGGDHDPIVIAQNVRVVCLQPSIDPGIGDEDENEDEPEQPVIGEGSGSECVGPGCDGEDDPTGETEPEPEDEAEAEPEADESTLPAAIYLPLPNVRLPGNDLAIFELRAPDWRLCRQACTEDDRCRAWTYRRPGTWRGTAEAVCLLKRRPGPIVPDPCCRSGIKN